MMKALRFFLLTTALVASFFSKSSAFLDLSLTTDHDSHELATRLFSTASNPEVKPFTSMQYDDVNIEIYRPDSTKPLFYYSPLAQMEPESPGCFINPPTLQPRVSFRVQMWNKAMQQAVRAHITQVMGRAFFNYQIQPIPFDQAILKTSVLKSSEDRFVDNRNDERCQTANSWLEYNETMRFVLHCFRKDECEQVASELRTNSLQYSHYKIAFSLTKRRDTETRQPDVTSDAIQASQIAAKLNSWSPSKQITEVLLRNKDTQQFLWNAVSNIVRQNFRNPEIVPRESEVLIYDQLYEMIVGSKITIYQHDDTRWNSVYWEDTHVKRPDVIVKSLNGRLLNMRHQNHDTQGMQAVDDVYETHKEWIFFDGEKFMLRPIELVTIKLNIVRDRRMWRELTKLNVPYHPDTEMVKNIAVGPHDYEDVKRNSNIGVNLGKNKQSILSRLIVGEKLVVRLKNARDNEYLYPGGDNWVQDTSRRRVFTWRNKEDQLGTWAEWLISGVWKDGIFRVRFSTLRYPGEYMYPSIDEYSYDKERRRVFTWRQISNPEDVHTWADGAADWLLNTYRIDTDRHPQRYAIFNLKRKEYLYATSDEKSFDDSRRRVFTWGGAEDDAWNALKNQWDIEVIRAI